MISNPLVGRRGYKWRRKEGRGGGGGVKHALHEQIEINEEEEGRE